MTRHQLAFLLVMYVFFGVMVGAVTDRTDGEEFDVADYMFVVIAWPIVLFGGAL
jgi:hypothetical protein